MVSATSVSVPLRSLQLRIMYLTSYRFGKKILDTGP